MDQRAIDTLEWLDELDAEVLAHPGMAYVEREILRLLVAGTAPSTSGVTSTAYRMEAERRVLPMQNRAEARSVAHIVMFATNFGQVSMVAPSGLGAALDDAVVEHEEDTDTLGELLIAAHIAGHTSALITAARSVFDAAWAAEPLEFNNYHVILVGAILYAITGA